MKRSLRKKVSVVRKKKRRMPVFTKDQKERAHKKLIHDYGNDGRDSGTITQNDIDAECERAAKPPAKKAPAKKPPATVVPKGPATPKAPGKAVTKIAPTLVVPPPPPPPPPPAPIVPVAAKQAKKPAKKQAVVKAPAEEKEEAEEVEEDLEDLEEEVQEAEVEEKEMKRKKPGKVLGLAETSTRYAQAMTSIRIVMFSVSTIPSLGSHVEIQFVALKALPDAVKAGGMIAFGNRWWALPKVFPEKWPLLEA